MRYIRVFFFHLLTALAQYVLTLQTTEIKNETEKF